MLRAGVMLRASSDELPDDRREQVAAAIYPPLTPPKGGATRTGPPGTGSLVTAAKRPAHSPAGV